MAAGWVNPKIREVRVLVGGKVRLRVDDADGMIRSVAA